MAPRYRFLVTDGVDTIQAMPTTQLSQLITDGIIRELSLIRIDSYTTNVVSNTKIMVLLKAETVGKLDKPLLQAGTGSGSAPTTTHPPLATPAAVPSNVPHSSNVMPPSAPAYGQKAQYNTPAATSAYGVAQPSPQANPYSSHTPTASYAPSNTSYNPPNAPYGQSNAPYVPPSAPSYGTSSSSSSYGASSYGGYGAGQSHGGAVVRSDAGSHIVPITAINPYSNKWTIKARITSKSEKRHWSNAKGEGTLFSIDLLDSTGGEIRGTFFKDACEKFYPILEEGKVYTFSNGLVKVGNSRQFSHIKNQYELTFNVTSEIQAARDDNDIKAQQYNFTKIDALNNSEVGTVVDVIGIVRSASDCSEILSTKLGGKTLLKRDLTLVDDTNCEVKLTLWGEKAQAAFDWASQPIAAFRNVKVGDFGGRSLSSMNGSSIAINPDIPEGLAIYRWQEQFHGSLPASMSLSTGGAGGGSGPDPLERRKTISSIRDENMGSASDKGDFISFRGTVIYIKHDSDPWYAACPTPGCNKKVTESMSGEWLCEKCARSFPNCSRRYILNLTMADSTGSAWFTVFNEQAERLLGVPAQTLHDYRTENNEADYEKVFSDALFKTFLCKARVKQELVNDEMRTKSAVQRLDDVDLVAECAQMLEALRKYE